MNRKRPKAKPDVNQRAAAAVQAITGTGPVNGEELIGDPATREALRKAKEADKVRQSRRLARR